MRKLLLAARRMSLTGPAEAAEWRRIFDGRSLTDWTPKITGRKLGDNYRRTFSAKNGAIRISYDRYDRFAGRFGHLAYARPVAAPFRVRFQYRFYGDYLPDVEAWQHSNSGLMFLGQPPRTMTREQKFPISLELQLLGPGGPAPTTGNLCTPGTYVTMASRRLTEHCTNSAGPVFPNGRWVQVELEVRADGGFTHFVEGKPVLHYSGAELDPADADSKALIARGRAGLGLTSGYLYLQSEGHPVEFRNIELKELGPAR